MKVKLAPSLARADLLNLETEIHRLEEAKVDLIHIDILDTTYCDSILLSPEILPAIRKMTDIPLDIHVMIEEPERIFTALLPHCRDNYVCFQAEAVKDICKLLRIVKGAGGKPAVALNPCTPLSILEDTIPYIEMVNLIVRSAGCPLTDLNQHILDKIIRTRRLLDENDNPNVEIEVDGSIDYKDAKLTVDRGANILGIWHQSDISRSRLCRKLREITGLFEGIKFEGR